ncbi:SNRNP25 [Bugula neritina]|uniref:SNRNP25 n=1 Tax=Bugula neritina TaxID=10212 RepID=A0A7J7KSA5_BUGNE|nr:SNRNP25 [Bugula neritina]
MQQIEDEELSHIEICSIVSASLAELIKDDPLVSDLPSDSTLIEIQSQIAVEYGQSISLYLDRPSLETIKLAVVNKSTIKDLKIAIEKQVGRYMERQKKHTTHLSWKYFWRKHWIVHNRNKLTDNNKTIQDYQIKNKDHLQLCKRLKPNITDMSKR